MCLQTNKICQCKQQHRQSLVFGPEYAKFKLPDGIVFEIEKGKQYYLSNLNEKRSTNEIKEIKSVSHTVNEWHKILGHCNIKDVMKSESAIDRIYISNMKMKD